VELRRYLGILRRRLVLIVVTVLAAVGAAWIGTPQTASYTATTTLYIGARQLLNPGGTLINDYLTGIQRITQTYSQMIQSDPIAEDALKRTGLQRSTDSVVSKTSAQPEAGTQLLQISVSDSNPAVAQQLANAVADSFVTKVQTYDAATPAGEGTIPTLPAYVFQQAKLPLAPDPSGLGRNLALGAVFGFLGAAALAFLLEYLDVTVKSPADAERRLELPVLAVVPMQRQRPPAYTYTSSPTRSSA
jgi:succinoglycan biosynthesis transport protein ExoP